MIIFGASGHAKVIIDIVKSTGQKSIDFILDDDRSIKSIGDFEVKHEVEESMVSQDLVIAVGNNITRKKLANQITNNFCEALKHRSAVVSEDVVIEEGSVIMPNAIINSSVVIGKHCIINSGAVIEHDCELQDFVHISPGSTVTGNVKIGEGAQIGAGATVIPGVKIGRWATIGAGAVIINDVPDFAVVVGNPGKVIKFNKLENE